MLGNQKNSLVRGRFLICGWGLLGLDRLNEGDKKRGFTFSLYKIY